MQQQFAQFGLGQGQGQFGNNSNLVQLYRQQQMMAMNGMNNPAAMMVNEEHKPFRCPVIGCEKAYKNQNGLKYVPHLLHFNTADFLAGITRHMAIKHSNYTRTEMVLSLLSIQKPRLHTQVHKEWRRRSLISVTSAENDIRI